MPSRSADLFQRALHRIPGGVNSPVRAFRGVGGEPFFVSRGKGARIWDADDNEYIDYVLSWGPLALGPARAGRGARMGARGAESHDGERHELRHPNRTRDATRRARARSHAACGD